MEDLSPGGFSPQMREQCAECALLTPVDHLLLCSECDDHICGDCATACDTKSPDHCNCTGYVCLFFLNDCKCPEQQCGQHSCGRYCPECYRDGLCHQGDCYECEECEVPFGEIAWIPWDCSHEWHVAGPGNKPAE